jgi:hypothetical protein
VPTLEIRLDPAVHETWCWASLEKAVVEEESNRTWVYSRTPHVDQSVAESPHNTSNAIYRETRYRLNSVPVYLRHYGWGVTLWSGYDPMTNDLLKSVARRFGGRWTPRFRTWRYPLGVLELLPAYLVQLGAIKVE